MSVTPLIGIQVNTGKALGWLATDGRTWPICFLVKRA
jgi:hypothetical protein